MFSCLSARASFVALKFERILPTWIFIRFVSVSHTYSEQDFEPLLSKLHNADNTLSGTDFVSNFRTQLLEALRQDHNHFWQTQFVDDNLTCLRDVIVASRQANASISSSSGGDNTPAAAWRPTGRTAADQVSFYRTFLINAKLTYLQKQMARQPEQLKHLVDQLELHRGRIELMQVKREALNKQMALRNVELQAASETLRGLNEELAACSED